MLYQAYKEKLAKRRRIFDCVWRFRILILLGIALVLAVIATLLGVKGIVYGEVFPVSAEYGQSLGSTAKSFLGKAAFEHRLTGEEEWKEGEPRAAGDYEVRAVGKTVVGTYRYGEIHTLSISPAAAEVRVKNDELIYGEKPEFTAPLKYDDVLEVGGYDYEDKGDIINISPKISSVSVISASGEDVTSSYDLTTFDRDVRYLPRPITIRTQSETFGYDGKPHGNSKLEIVSELGLSEGHSFGEEYKLSMPAPVNVGSRENVVTSLSILDGDGNAVTERYRISYETGTLTVEPRKITVATPSFEWTYDGSEHKLEEYSVTSGTIAEGQQLEVSASGVKNAGDYRNLNERSFRVTDGGSDVSSNYDITYDFGKVRILPAPLTVSTPQSDFVYDGSAHNYGKNDISLSGKLAEGETLTAPEVGRTFINANEAGYLNDIPFDITDGNGVSTKSNYDITYDYGAVTVRRRKAEIYALSKSLEYGGALQGFAAGDYAVSPDAGEGLAESDSLRVSVPFTALNAGNYENKPSYSIISRTDGRDVTQNYALTENFGGLEIQKRVVTIKTASDEFTYDGTEHYYYGDSITVSVGKLAPGETLSYLTGGWGVSGAVYTLTEANEDGYLFSPAISIVNAGGINTMGNYEVTYDYGTIVVHRRPAKIVASAKEIMYNGAAQGFTAGDYRISPIEGNMESGLGAGDYLSVSTPCTATDAGTYENHPVYSIYSYGTTAGASPSETTENYIISEELGKLTVSPRVIAAITASENYEYDGTAHSNANVRPSAPLPLNHTLQCTPKPSGSSSAVNLPSVTEVGSVTNEFSFDWKIFDGGRDISGNYSMSGVAYGTLTVYARKVTLRTKDAVEMYDDKEHSAEEFYSADNTELVAGHRINPSYPKFVNAGKHSNTVSGDLKVYDSGGADVSKNYQITWQYGTVEILRRPITVRTKGCAWRYDGLAHLRELEADIDTIEIDYYDGDDLGHKVNIKMTSDPIDAGTYTYSCSVTDIRNGKGTDVTANYDIRYEYGEILVSKREVSVQTGSLETVYDEQKHSAENYKVIGNIPLAGGQRLEVVYPEFKDAGIYRNDPADNWKVYDSREVDVSKNYVVSWDCGTINILHRPITVSAKEKEWIYDGTSHLSVADLEIKYYEDDSLGHRVTALFSQITDAGEHEIRFRVLLDSANIDVTRNYDITYSYGAKARILKRRVMVITESKTWVWEEGKIYSTGFSISKIPGVEESGLVSSHRLSGNSVVLTEITDTDWEAVYVTNELSDIKITQSTAGGNVDRMANYEIEHEWGKLRVKSPVVAYIYSITKEYDGTPLTLTDEDYYIQKMPPDVRTEDIKIELNISLSIPGTLLKDVVYALSVHEVTCEGENRIDFAGNDIILRVTKRSIRIKTASIKAERGEDDTPLYGNQTDSKPYWIAFGTLLDGHRIDDSVEVTGVLPPDEEFALNLISEVKIVDGEGNDVTEFYLITYDFGMLSWTDD